MRISFVLADDWEAMYINEKLVTQGHSIRKEEVLMHLGIECEQFEADYKWMEERSDLPENLEDCMVRP